MDSHAVLRHSRYSRLDGRENHALISRTKLQFPSILLHYLRVGYQISIPKNRKENLLLKDLGIFSLIGILVSNLDPIFLLVFS